MASPYKLPVEDRTCRFCYAIFTPAYPADPKAFCSRECANAAAKTTLCPVCKSANIELGGMCRACDAERQRGYRMHMRDEVLNVYGGQCVCCGEAHREFLALDHVNGDGAEHRKGIGSGTSMYRWAKKNGYPGILQILCHNCNVAIGNYGFCPHGNIAPRAVAARGWRKKEEQE